MTARNRSAEIRECLRVVGPMRACDLARVLADDPQLVNVTCVSMLAAGMLTRPSRGVYAYAGEPGKRGRKRDPRSRAESVRRFLRKPRTKAEIRARLGAAAARNTMTSLARLGHVRRVAPATWVAVTGA